MTNENLSDDNIRLLLLLTFKPVISNYHFQLHIWDNFILEMKQIMPCII